jgi:hypothetical protein
MTTKYLTVAEAEEILAGVPMLTVGAPVCAAVGRQL